MVDFKNIPLKQIKADANQPRKFYDQTSMEELTASIKEKGILQPILVRPSGKNYILVCGERRFKASQEAGLTEIPAMVRELSNGEALELQIIENLQRKDVHPMEEAVAFNSLSEKQTIEEIALRVGKSASYVAKRIKLNDLVQEAQEIFYFNHLSYSDALLLARLEPKTQKAIIKDRAPKNWKTRKEDWSISGIERFVENQEMELSGASFKTSDAKLYPEAGACTNCLFNSANQPLLFEDQKRKVCTKKSCFEIKQYRAKKLRFEKVAQDPEKVCVVVDSYLTDTEKQELELAKEAGIVILDKKLYDTNYCDPDELKSFEDFVEDEYGYMDDDDYKPSDLELKKEYQEYKAAIEKDIKEYEDAVKSGRIIKAYVVAGSGSGREVSIRLKSTAAAAVVSSTTGNSGDQDLLSEIERISIREERSKGLDEEKIYQKVRELALNTEDPPADLDTSFENAFSLDNWIKGFGYTDFKGVFRRVVASLMYAEIGYRNKEELNLILMKDEHPDQEQVFYYFFESGHVDICKIAQFFVREKGFAPNGSINSSIGNKASMELAKDIFETDFKSIVFDQHEVAAQRSERINKRIEALKNKLSSN